MSCRKSSDRDSRNDELKPTRACKTIRLRKPAWCDITESLKFRSAVVYLRCGLSAAEANYSNFPRNNASGARRASPDDDVQVYHRLVFYVWLTREGCVAKNCPRTHLSREIRATFARGRAFIRHANTRRFVPPGPGINCPPFVDKFIGIVIIRDYIASR